MLWVTRTNDSNEYSSQLNQPNIFLSRTNTLTLELMEELFLNLATIYPQSQLFLTHAKVTYYFPALCCIRCSHLASQLHIYHLPSLVRSILSCSRNISLKAYITLIYDQESEYCNPIFYNFGHGLKYLHHLLDLKVLL